MKRVCPKHHQAYDSETSCLYCCPVISDPGPNYAARVFSWFEKCSRCEAQSSHHTDSYVQAQPYFFLKDYAKERGDFSLEVRAQLGTEEVLRRVRVVVLSDMSLNTSIFPRGNLDFSELAAAGMWTPSEELDPQDITERGVVAWYQYNSASKPIDTIVVLEAWLVSLGFPKNYVAGLSSSFIREITKHLLGIE